VKEKIKSSIGKKISLLPEILKDLGIDDMSETEVREQRWIMNAKIAEHFDFYTQKLFPSLQVQNKLAQGMKIPQKYSQSYA